MALQPLASIVLSSPFDFFIFLLFQISIGHKLHFALGIGVARLYCLLMLAVHTRLVVRCAAQWLGEALLD